MIKINEKVFNKICKKIDELVNGNNTRILYYRNDKERYAMDNGLVFKWNDIIVDEILPAVERGIKDNIIQNIAVEESYLEDYIVDYEENDSRGEDSYYVSEYDVSNELDYLKTNIHINTNFKEFLDFDTLVDKWEDRKRWKLKQEKHRNKTQKSFCVFSLLDIM